MDIESVKAIKREIGASELRIVGLVIWALHPNTWWFGLAIFLGGCLLSDSARWWKAKKEAAS